MTEHDNRVRKFFADPDKSDAVVLATHHVAAPIVQGATLTMNEIGMGGGVRVVYFVFDASPSMEPVAKALRDAYTNDYVQAVKDGRESDISTLRIGGCAFSYGSPKPIWKGTDPNQAGKDAYFHSLDSLPPLTKAEYDPDCGNGTSLHRAIIEGTATALRYAAEVEKETSVSPQVDIIVLSDGADNEYRTTAAEVKRMIKAANRSRMRFVFFYFQTDQGLPNAKEYAVNDLGFDGEQVDVFLSKPGETKAERDKRLRRMTAVTSRVSATRGTSAVMATSAVLEDEELV